MGRLSRILSIPILPATRISITGVAGFLVLAGLSHSQAPYRINCSGPAFTDALGAAWAEDAHFVAGSMYTAEEMVTSGNPVEVYQDVRWNDPSLTENLKYEFAVADGNYTVKLHFAEIWPGAYFEGGRVFNVNINGGRVIENLDIFATVGALAPLVKVVDVASVGGKIVIEFGNVIQNAAVAGIEILPSDGTGLLPRAAAARGAAGWLRAQASPNGSLAVPAFAGARTVRLLDPQGRLVAVQSARPDRATVFQGLRPGLYFAAPGR